MTFIDTRLSDRACRGSSGGPRFMTRVTPTASGFELRIPKWIHSRHEYSIAFDALRQADMFEVLNFHQAMNGRAYSFRFKDFADFNSVTPLETVSPTDQTLGNGDGSTAAFQLVKNYTDGRTYQRTITKPVSGTVRVSIDDIEQTGNWSVNLLTGVVTFDNLTGTITAATSASPIVLTSASHGLVTGDTVVFSTFTGDWAALNGIRYTVTRLGTNTFSIPVDGSGFTAYSANGGSFATVPQSGEVVKAGFEFDVPVRFDIDYIDISFDASTIQTTEVPLIEVRE